MSAVRSGTLPAMRGERMEREIGAQARLLARVSPGYAESARAAVGGLRPELVLLVARGSSDNAALYARYLIEIHLGLPAVLAAPSAITRYGAEPKYPRSLVVGISQSGAGPDVAEVLETMRGLGHATLALTNTPGSRITDAAERTILLDVGEETAVAATKTFSASLLALYGVVRALGADLPEPALYGEEWIAECRSAAEEASGIFVRCHPTFALGRGYGFAAAHETALKLMECALIPCKAYSAADFQHGPKALAGHGSAALDFSGEMAGIAEQGCEMVLPPAPDVPPEMLPIWQIVFGQWLALFAARARGLDPDAPRHLSKVTRTL